MANSRFAITLSDELKGWYVNRAKDYGMSISSLMVMALAQYKEQQEAMKAMNNITSYMEQLESVKGVKIDKR